MKILPWEDSVYVYIYIKSHLAGVGGYAPKKKVIFLHSLLHISIHIYYDINITSHMDIWINICGVYIYIRTPRLQHTFLFDNIWLDIYVLDGRMNGWMVNELGDAKKNLSWHRFRGHWIRLLCRDLIYINNARNCCFLVL